MLFEGHWAESRKTSPRFVPLFGRGFSG